MAAAYAALLSLLHTIEQIQHHPRPPVSLNKKQVESLTENVNFLQDFLEGYSHGDYSEEVDVLVSRIADAAYAAEDVIESHIVDQIQNGSKSQRNMEEITSVYLYQDLQKVIDDTNFIKKEVKEIKQKLKVQDQRHRVSERSGSSRLPSTIQSTMVGFDDVLYEVMDKLIGGRPDCQIMPIVGMGGIGKTTLARHIFENQLIVQYFDVRAWVTISQEYSMREILLKVLLEVLQEDEQILSQMQECELRDKLHKRLSGRRYLIIMDDLWNIEVWDQLKFCFPHNKSGSRIMLTTRLSKLAFQITHSRGIELGLLDENTSWNLLCKNVFGKEDCPPELEEIGREIASRCGGLPLLITVIGGLLVKSEQTQEYWQYVAENLSSIVSLNDESCLKILQTSYKELPIRLKPCFLYMGVFREDYLIQASELIKLWISEGFIKQIGDKSMEMVAEEYLTDLIERNLVLGNRGLNGKIKFCSIHDVLRELCLKEAWKQKFLCVLRPDSLDIPQGINTERRIAIHQSESEKASLSEALQAIRSASLTRTLICYFGLDLSSHDLRLARVLKTGDKYLITRDRHNLKSVRSLVNLRFLALHYYDYNIPHDISLFWNLQVFRCAIHGVATSFEIWKMPQLRHVKVFELALPDPREQDDVVLENLQTLSYIRNFECSEKVAKKIPNIKKLTLSYRGFLKKWSTYCLNNLGLLHKLENLGLACRIYEEITDSIQREMLQNLTFPHSLKKLTLFGTNLHWEDMTTKVGALPLLQVLKLEEDSCKGPKWETVEGQFCSLKVLSIQWCDLECWMTGRSHFPRLEHLHLEHLYNLKEIPLGIGEIPTLQSIRLIFCSDSAVTSAKAIVEDQKENYGNESLNLYATAPVDLYLRR